ncbi:outer membrane beta-barrel protein [Mucilaginibacter angelicae]|uniref:Outer membrane beta-barrel protein n=1 Tax=Mucilaginibacter angelicae TaxID=869718 RepID=A0ABV6LA74_9SPHI
MPNNFLISKVFKIIAFIVLFSNTYLAYAQNSLKGTVKGVVVDERKSPLPSLTITLRSQVDSSSHFNSSSSETGAFSIGVRQEGAYTLKISLLGYETAIRKNILVDAHNPVVDLGVIKLNPSVKMLSTVNVTAQKPLIERRADKTIINLNSTITTPSVMELFNQLPGVQVDPSDQINLNGRDVKIYIDGKATPLSSEALASLLKGMSPTSIQKIELIAHPSSKYDAAGSGGIINIVRKKNKKDGLNGTVYGGIGQGEYAKYSGGLNLNYKGKSYNIFVNTDNSFNKYFVNNELRTQFFDNANLTGQSTAFINSVRKNRTYTPNVGIDFYFTQKTTLSLSVYDGITIFNKDAHSHTTGVDANLSQTNPTSFDNLVKTNSNNFSSSAHLASELDTAGKELSADLDYYRYTNNSTQNNVNSVFDTLGTSLSNAMSLFDQDRNFSIYSAKVDYTQPIKKDATLELGLKSSYVRSNNSNRFFNLTGNDYIQDDSQNDFFRYSENINAFYATYNKTNKKFSYQFGVRGENTWGKGEQLQTGQVFNRNYFQLFPSMYFNYKFKGGHGLNLSADKKTDRPTYENLNPLIRIINSDNYLQGNPNLQPVISYNTSLTYSFKDALYATFNYSFNKHDFIYLTVPFDSTGIATTLPENNKHSQYFSFILAYTKQIKPWWFTSTNIRLAQQSFTTGGADNSGLNTSGMLSFNFDTYNSFALSKRFTFLTLVRYRGKSIERNVTNDPYVQFTTGLRQLIFGTRGSLSFNLTDVFHTYKSKYVQNSPLIRQYWNNHYEATVGRLSFTYNFGGKVKKIKSGDPAEDEKKRTNIKEN